MRGRTADRVASGIPGFDEITDGGIIRNTIVSVSGDIGTGKTIFGMQFLYNGASEYDENGMYICFEEPKKIMYRNMLKFGWNIKALEDSQKIVFLEYPPHEVGIFFEQEDTLLNLIDKFGVSRIVVDPVGIMGMHFEDNVSRKAGLMKFTDKLRKWGCTSLMLSGTRDQTTDITSSIEAIADASVRLYNKLIGGRRMRGIEVAELRGSAHSQLVHQMHIGPKGIEIDPHSVLEISE
ncbi:MAG: ATPase domain-containing protein [Candidatus Micrarchaeia archaeon]